MTEYSLYCDESRHTSDPSQPYIVIGALQCEREQKRRLVSRIHNLMALHGVHGEAGWKRLSPNKRDFYFALLTLFVEEADLSFRCIVVDRRQLDHEKYNDGDKELGFYKLYYQMLVHWLRPGNGYHIYLDWQQNKEANRFKELQVVLNHKLSGRARIECLETLDSHNQPLLQLADLLIGAVGFQANELQKRENSSAVKNEFVDTLCKTLNCNNLSNQTLKKEEKFNVFNWQGS